MIGCDFETFVYDKYNNIIDCSKLIPEYNKKSPFIINNYLITHDRYCLECSIPPFEWNRTSLQLYNEIRKGIVILQNFIKQYGDFIIKFKESIKLDRFQTFQKGFEQNIYLKENIQFSKEIKSNFCTAGLHIHFDNILNKKRFIRKLDISLGIAYKIINPFSKRKNYGQLGSYREKQYNIFTKGFEYRVLGGSMLNKYKLIFTSILLNQFLKQNNYESNII